MMQRIVRAALLAAAFTAMPGLASAQSEQEAVMATVTRFLNALGSRDSAALRAATVVDGSFVIVVPRGDSATVHVAPLSASIASIARAPKPLLERIWNPVITADGPIATVRAQYDFHDGGVFSHCGVDIFTLAKDARGWRITGGTYTVQRTGCAPSPLGPPRQE